MKTKYFIIILFLISKVNSFAKFKRHNIKMSNALSEQDVFELVLEYLSNKGYAETEQVLKKEATKVPVAKSLSSSHSSSRLQDLLEKSYVTELASGVFLPKKAVRSHLDAILIPNTTEQLAGIRLEGLTNDDSLDRLFRIFIHLYGHGHGAFKIG